MSQKGQSTSTTKELKIIARPVVTLDAVKKDLNKLKILHIINELNEISEKGLINAIYILKMEKNIAFTYNFTLVGQVPSSKEISEDIRILLYLGLVETNPVTRKLRLTSLGKEFLTQNKLEENLLNELKTALDEVKNKIIAEDKTIELSVGPKKRRRFK